MSKSVTEIYRKVRIRTEKTEVIEVECLALFYQQKDKTKILINPY